MGSISNKIKKRIIDKHTSVRVGVPDALVPGENLKLSDVAFINEFGSSGIPQRSFLRTGVAAAKEQIPKVFKQYAKHQGGIDLSQGLDAVGLFMQTAVQKQFRNNDWEKNAPSTINSKGSSRPLIDTGQLRQSIQHELS